ncbi:MAG: MarR family transcriptional regulator [Proteobacteria bacterium]|nr:MarR family transcriptional regulator [Pseudomonadota bacterium]
MVTNKDCIVFLLAKGNQKAQHNLKKRLKPYGLTTVQGLILGTLFEEDGLTSGEIGKRLVLDNATVSGVLDRLSEAGWIEKKTDEDDRRIQRIYLSQDKNREADMEFVIKLYQARQEANEETLRNLTTEERILLKRLLKDLV